MRLLATCFRPLGLRGPATIALLAFAAAASARGFEWQVDVTPAGELFAALELSQTPASGADPPGGGNGLVSVRLRGETLPRRLSLRVETAGLRTPARLELTRAPSDRRTRLDLAPRLDWDPRQLRELREPRLQSLRVTLEADGVVHARSIEVRLHPLDDAPYYVREGRERVDLGWIFAGYVDPRDPVVDEVLAMAREADPAVDVAPRRNDAAGNLRRVAAVWAALERHGLRYDNSDPALSRGPVVWSQRVRLPAATWRDRRANCIDSSVLIAAVLERIGLPPLIVLVPGHAFVGYRNEDGSAEYIETTLLGARAGAIDSFERARAAGHLRWRKSASKLDGRHAPDHALVDVRTARRLGIRPLSTGDSGRVDAGGTVATRPAERAGAE